MKIILKIVCILAIGSFMAGSTLYSQTIPFGDARWEISGVENKIENYLGKKSLYLKGGQALIKDSDFTNGIIEFKIAFTGERGFMGAVWRLEDENNYEEFYLRPHQSGNPDANQYTPVFNGISGWQLYYGEDYASPVKYKFNQWNIVKIIVSGKYAEIYINDMNTPALFVNELKRNVKSGKVGLECSNFTPVHFADFEYKTIENPKLKNKPKLAMNLPENIIANYSVSSHFKEEKLNHKYLLTKDEKEKLNWTKINCETTGFVNLARIQGIKEGLNTVFARVIINSDKDQYKKVSFGYSDLVKVYLNDKLEYSGQNNYQSRDYRYLGTIGFFDDVYLPLKKGENELMFAVSESFGGWGIMARIENMDEISIK